MDYLFPTSGVETNILIPPLVALFISMLTSTAGVSGAFLILPYQVSVLGFTSPAVSSTNFVYNIVAIPSGVYRYIREGRMAWPLTWVIVLGTVPGVLIGYLLRMRILPDPRTFKLFVGLVLLYLGIRLLYDLTPRAASGRSRSRSLETRFRERSAAVRREQDSRVASGLPADAVVRTLRVGIGRVEYEFWGERFSFSTPGVFLLSLIVGVIGGVYGIGGGAIVAPFCVAVFGLPVYTVAGAALMGTFITSIAGVVFYSLLPGADGVAKSPDWLLGLLFGIGGFAGMYIGARLQKFLPQQAIKLLLGAIVLFTAVKYISQYW